MSSIVVGVDGSPGARHALYWALDEAHKRGAPVRVITAWSDRADPQTRDPANYARRLQRREVEIALSNTTAPPPLSCSVIKGDPVDVLVSSARKADLLVLGSRDFGHGPTRSGSVRHACMTAASCPVVIIPPPHLDGETGQPEPAISAVSRHNGERPAQHGQAPQPDCS